MRRRTLSPRTVTFAIAATIVCLTVLGTPTASAALPIITRTVNPALPDGANGWYVGDVDVTLSVDLQGGTEISRSGDCDVTVNITTDTPGTDVTCSIQTDGGSATDTVTIKRDATDPTLAPAITPSTLVVNGPGSATSGAADATSGIATESCDAVDTTTAGPSSLQCRATDNAGNMTTQTVNYTVQPHGPAASVVATKGDGQTAYVTERFASALAVTVTDAQGNPVPGETVVFHAPFSGPSADLSRPSNTTNANGVASVRAFANDKVGRYTVKAKVAGVQTARFALRNAVAPYFSEGFSKGLRKWKRTGDISIAKKVGKPAPSALLRARNAKTYAIHRFSRTYATACVSAWVRLNSIGGEAVALMRFRGTGDSGISRVSVESDRELFVRNDRRGGVKLSGTRLPLGTWHEIELCTRVGTKGSITLYLDGAKILGWRQRLGDRPIAAINLIENDVKTFSLNVDGLLVDRRPGAPV
jgi:hypothetical protein